MLAHISRLNDVDEPIPSFHLIHFANSTSLPVHLSTCPPGGGKWNINQDNLHIENIIANFKIPMWLHVLKCMQSWAILGKYTFLQHYSADYKPKIKTEEQKGLWWTKD